MSKIRKSQSVDSDFISEIELDSGYKTDTIDSVFPVTVDSVDSTTKTVNISGTDLNRIEALPGDTAEISGGNAAGDYTIATIESSTSFTVEESINDASSGDLTIYNPPGTTKIKANNNNWSVLSSGILQSGLDEIDTGLNNRPTFTEHENEDSLVHNLAEGNYSEVTRNGEFVTKRVVWQSSSKNTKVREYTYTYDNRLLTQASVTQYDDTGTALKTVTRNYTRNSLQEVVSYTDTVS